MLLVCAGGDGTSETWERLLLPMLNAFPHGDTCAHRVQLCEPELLHRQSHDRLGPRPRRDSFLWLLFESGDYPYGLDLDVIPSPVETRRLGCGNKLVVLNMMRSICPSCSFSVLV